MKIPASLQKIARLPQNANEKQLLQRKQVVYKDICPTENENDNHENMDT